jgi:hypothetical protein
MNPREQPLATGPAQGRAFRAPSSAVKAAHTIFPLHPGRRFAMAAITPRAGFWLPRAARRGGADLSTGEHHERA